MSVTSCLIPLILLQMIAPCKIAAHPPKLRPIAQIKLIGTRITVEYLRIFAKPIMQKSCNFAMWLPWCLCNMIIPYSLSLDRMCPHLFYL